MNAAPAAATAVATIEPKKLKPIEEVRQNLTAMIPQLTLALPSHISAEKFQRVAITAISVSAGSKNDLLKANRNSLYAACMKSAQDGLLPDGREAALVVYGEAVQYMPMIAGILKKVRNSGELGAIAAHIVYRADVMAGGWTYFVDEDGEHFKHTPDLFAPDRGDKLLVYAVAKTKDGGVYFEPMTIADVEHVRAKSKAKNAGPWVTDWDEMAKKTALRRLSKRLPMSTDLEAALSRDDDLANYTDGDTIDNTTGEVTTAAPRAATPGARRGRPPGAKGSPAPGLEGVAAQAPPSAQAPKNGADDDLDIPPGLRRQAPVVAPPVTIDNPPQQQAVDDQSETDDTEEEEEQSPV